MKKTKIVLWEEDETSNLLFCTAYEALLARYPWIKRGMSEKKKSCRPQNKWKGYKSHSGGMEKKKRKQEKVEQIFQLSKRMNGITASSINPFIVLPSNSEIRLYH